MEKEKEKSKTMLCCMVSLMKVETHWLVLNISVLGEDSYPVEFFLVKYRGLWTVGFVLDHKCFQ